MGEAKRRALAATQAIEENRQRVERMFDDFEALLNRAEVKIAPGSALESTILFMRQLKYIG